MHLERPLWVHHTHLVRVSHLSEVIPKLLRGYHRIGAPPLLYDIIIGYTSGSCQNFKFRFFFSHHLRIDYLGHGGQGLSHKSLLQMGPDPTQAYFSTAVNKSQTRLWPKYFLTQPDVIFLNQRGKRLKNLEFLGEIFQTQTKDGWLDVTRATKNLTWAPH